MSTTMLVTGGAGFIGSNFVRFVLANRPEVNVVNVDALTYSGNLENLADVADEARYSFVKADICDRDAMAPLIARCDCIVHFAAESHVDRSIIDSTPFIRTNASRSSGAQLTRATSRTSTGVPSDRAPMAVLRMPSRSSYWPMSRIR